MRIRDISLRVGLKGVEDVEISFISVANDRYFGNSSGLLFSDHQWNIYVMYNVILQVGDEALYAPGHLFNLLNQTRTELTILRQYDQTKYILKHRD